MFKKIAFTIYAVNDMKKARAFYEGILGLTPSDEYPATKDSLWIEYDIGPDTLAIGRSDEWKPSTEGTVAALEAIDFDAVIKKLKAKKVPFKLEPQSWPSCNMAVVSDPDGNNIIIHHKHRTQKKSKK